MTRRELLRVAIAAVAGGGPAAKLLSAPPAIASQAAPLVVSIPIVLGPSYGQALAHAIGKSSLYHHAAVARLHAAIRQQRGGTVAHRSAFRHPETGEPLTADEIDELLDAGDDEPDENEEEEDDEDDDDDLELDDDDDA